MAEPGQVIGTRQDAMHVIYIMDSSNFIHKTLNSK